MIFIVGSPRSGTTFTTNYIGKFTDSTYNEPWSTHEIEWPRLWLFPPNSKTIAFKYCENWRNIHILLNKYPKSVYVHVYRDPDNVVYSMSNDKPNSYPKRYLYCGYQGDERVRICMQRWYSNMMHCLALYNIIPQQYIELRYENLENDLKKLSQKINIEFDLNKLNFENRNISDIKLDWNLNKTTKGLRNLVKNYKGECLAAWINEKHPKLLQKVVL